MTKPKPHPKPRKPRAKSKSTPKVRYTVLPNKTLGDEFDLKWVIVDTKRSGDLVAAFKYMPDAENFARFCNHFPEL